MIIRAWLPLDRFREGRLDAQHDGETLLVARCRGEADNANAAQKDNIIEDPTRVGGDHPFGEYRVTRLVQTAGRTYGPWFIGLEPMLGECLEAAQNGRSGFGIHGGDLHSDGRLRETYGCLRVDNATADALARWIQSMWDRKQVITYTCQEAP